MLKITHNFGFFSCCSVKLHDIVEYFNYHKNIPSDVDSSEQFEWYKINKTGDITYDYFKHHNNYTINDIYSNEYNNLDNLINPLLSLMRKSFLNIKIP